MSTRVSRAAAPIPDAAALTGKSFGAERVILDGGRFVQCEFDGSTLVYFGGRVPDMDNCNLKGVKIVFEGPAKNTVELLRWLKMHKIIDF